MTCGSISSAVLAHIPSNCTARLICKVRFSDLSWPSRTEETANEASRRQLLPT